ncbi:MAG: S49 family peptidase [Candidatus Hadarchaeota archaeon]|nr:S49 family peptidase [Candidatus Hadarchaeota archaeon]
MARKRKLKPKMSKRERIFFRYISLIAAVALVISLTVYAYHTHAEPTNRIGIISIENSIYDFRYASKAEAALNDSSIEAVVVSINSPGGGANSCLQTEEQLRRLADEKPVVVIMGEHATSGAYLVGSASDYIYACTQTLTGGLGVIAVWPSYENHYKQEGIKYYVWKSGTSKDRWASWRGPTENENKKIQELIDEYADELFNRIVANRPETENTIDSLRDGSTVVGHEAIGYNLVDELGTYQDALEKAADMAGLKSGEYQTKKI